MNIVRLLISIVAVAVVIFIFDMVFHGMILGKSYGETAGSWRPMEEMEARRPFQMLCYFIISSGFCTVWAMGFASRGIRSGAIYGFFAGLSSVGGMWINFVFLPIPDQFKLPWALGAILSAVLGGIVGSLVYKPKTPVAG